MRFFEKTKGAISIFLVIILVPMMTMSSLFVDASKVELAKGLAESAGDLTLNTALTNYDTSLKELYGLLATAQDTEDLFTKLEDYYRTCIMSSGVNADDAEIYAEEIMNNLGKVSESGDTSDIINMELVDFTVQKAPNANLANATIIKKQVVDFMKYRAPINTGLSFVSSLKSFSTLSKQSELVEKKQEYYEAQQTVLEDLKTAWSHIAAYNKSSVSTDSSYLTNIKPTLDGYAASYKDYGKRTIKSLYKKYDPVVGFNYNATVTPVEVNKYDIKDGILDQTQNTWTVSYAGQTSYAYFSPSYSNPYNFNSKKFPSASEIKNAITGYYNALNNLDANPPPDHPYGTYDIQFVAQKKQEIERYTSAAYNFHVAYQKVQNVILWVDGYDKVSPKLKDKEGVEITKDSILSASLTIGKTTKSYSQWIDTIKGDSSYENRMDVFQSKVKDYTIYIRDAKTEYSAQYNVSDGQNIDTAISNISSKVNGYVTTLETAIGHLDDAITYLNSAKGKLTGAVATAKSSWNTVANDSSIKDTSLANQDKAEISQLDTYLNEDNINKLVTRLTNVKNDLTAVRDQIKAYKYADKFLGDITGYPVLESAMGAKWSDLNKLSMNNTEVTNTATERANSVWVAGNIDTKWVGQSGHQPNLLNDKVAMYNYLSTNFAGTDPAVDSVASSSNVKTEDEKNGKNLYNNIKNTSESTADSKSGGTDSGQAGTETSKKNEINSDAFASRPSKTSSTEGGGSIPSGKVNTKIDGTTNEDGTTDKGAAGKSASALSSLFSANFLSAIANMAEDFRDRLYVADYIMSMFSYDTIENEYKEKNNVTEVNAGDITSLTKNDISETNNFAYGAEVEYILYGGKNAGNLTKAYGTIYGIRFGFNLVYAFATSEIRESALAIATPISAATLGIIPVPLIQAVIIIGIACCESAIDLYDLSQGEKVPLYKSSQTWHCSISGLINAAKDEAKEKATVILKDVADSAVSAGVDKLNSLLDMSSDELDKLIEGSTNDIETAVGNAYDQVITENANAAIQQLTTLVNTAVQNSRLLNAGETYEAKKTQMKKWVKDELQAWGNQITGDDLAATVKREAVQLIVNNSDSYINGLFDAVETAAQNAVGDDAGATIDSIVNGATTVTDGVDKLGGKIMEQIELIRRRITSTINDAAGEVTRLKNEAISKVKDSISGGAEKLKNTLNEQIDGIFGGSGSGTGTSVAGTDTSTGLAALFSFSYSDYLRLFVMIGLYANEGKILLRTADVIEANMRHLGKEGFALKNSAAYVQVEATMQVKPTLIALPLFADTAPNGVDNSNWYTITYSGIAGY